jgi:nitroreductase
METMQTILTRRSIRRFDGRSVGAGELREIVRAGTYAASGGNRQRWRFVPVREPAAAAAVTETLGWLNGWRPPAGVGPTAHAVVLAPADASASVLADCAAATQNMALAAWDRGLGSCWCGSVRREVLAGLLGVPPEWQIFAVLALGHPAEEARAETSPGATAVTRDSTGRVVVPKLPLESVLTEERFGPAAPGG